MITPLLALYTPRRELEFALREELGDAFTIHRCDLPLTELPREIEDVQPAVLLVDFTSPGRGGHTEQRILEEIQADHPHCRLIMLIGDDCPEPLARQAACTHLIALCGPPFVPLVKETLHQLFPSAGAPEKTTTEQAASVQSPLITANSSRFAETVVCGLTRQFETATLSVKLMLQELELAAGHDVTILLIGETGVGKTYLARLIHELSPRRTQPFITVACGALPAELIESELFGHVQGAFTGAHADKEGKFLAADDGTMLLDEIDVLGPDQQVKLLRVIETGEFEPVGSNKTLRSKARLIAASNRDLEPLVAAGKFRADLYYRLNMLKFDIPPLRDRTADIPLLAKKFIAQHSRKHGVSIGHVEDDVYPLLLSYRWPGNVRELENVLRRAVIYCRDGVLRREHLPPKLLRNALSPIPQPVPASLPLNPVSSAEERQLPAEGQALTLERHIEQAEREIIQQALSLHNFSRTKTAKALGISRVTLYNKMRKYNIA